ncbi:NAD(P)-dependent oxidoreductase [Achromobacter sp. F4_2707]|uniref:NAD(P)-dependent oxidoreductase n=1 Tax=Achromobacter sp. F4_2707 TaxID=3114286 RepID=UPI0039C5BBD4
MQKEVGFIGLGAMGLPMLENLAKNETLKIYAFDASDKPFAQLQQHEAWNTRLFRAGSFSDFGTCDTFILMLPNSQITSSVVLGNNQQAGLAQFLPKSSLIIDMGSSDPIETIRLAAELEKHGITLVDAPVSGAVAKARTGDLTIMVGTDEAGLKAIEPLLSLVGSSLIPTGKLGAAHAMKALNNYVYAAGLLAVCEAVSIAQKMGLDTDRFAEILNTSSGRNVASETKLVPFILKENYTAGFSLRLQAKDLAIADRLCKENGMQARQLALCSDLWANAALSMPEADNTAIHQYIRSPAKRSQLSS